MLRKGNLACTCTYMYSIIILMVYIFSLSLSFPPFPLSLPTGHHASINEKGATAIMTVELDKEKGPQVRVVQGTEHPAFLQLFNGSMIVLHGKSDNNDISLCKNGKTFINM